MDRAIRKLSEMNANELEADFGPGEWVRLGSVESIPPGEGRAFIVQSVEIAVFRSRGGRLRAIENRCPHRGGPLADGITGPDRIVCPLHAHRFSLETGEGGEAHECVRVFPVTCWDGAVFIDATSLRTESRRVA